MVFLSGIYGQEEIKIGRILFLPRFPTDRAIDCLQWGLRCRRACKLDPQGFDHPVIVVGVSEPEVSSGLETKITFVQLTSTPRTDSEHTVYSPMGFWDETTPKCPSRYWLEGEQCLPSQTTVRLFHVFSLTYTVGRFKSFKDTYNSESTLNNLRLDEDSYLRLLMRLGRSTHGIVYNAPPDDPHKPVTDGHMGRRETRGTMDLSGQRYRQQNNRYHLSSRRFIPADSGKDARLSEGQTWLLLTYQAICKFFQDPLGVAMDERRPDYYVQPWLGAEA